MMPAIRLAALFPLLLSGCIVGAAILPQVMQSSFSAKRAALKRMWQDGQVTKESAQAACLPLLRAAEPGKAAPPPYPPEVCDFDSFVSQKFELTIALERG